MARVTKLVEDRRREFIAAARELFLANGFECTQMADVSARVGVASGLVYHYFRSKTDLLYAVMDELTENELASVREILAASDGTALDRLALLLTRQEREAGTLGPLFGATADPAVVEYCRQKMASALRPLLVSLIGQGNADGSWRCEHPDATALFVLQGLGGMIPEVAALELPERERWRDASRQILLRALGAAG
ncbi:MAG: TetR/AcrR family transcriptional regulator [Bifidobacteriaceae bacterium]|nr:TetR/AcrR family transcriptional regulator [Bifidobacteriaceae bacterium]